MLIWSRFMLSTQYAMRAFREQWFTASSRAVSSAVIAEAEARLARYEVNWAYYENTAYSRIHQWTASMRAEFGMYRYTRHIYNPAFSIGDFYATYLLGGRLDMTDDEAQDAGALPILTDNAAVRAAVARLWKTSNWQIEKDVLSLLGAVKGDACIMVYDDPDKQMTWMQVVDPAEIVNLELDQRGNVRGYLRQQMRTDPRPGAIPGSTVWYREEAIRDDSGGVVYRTFLNDFEYAWNEEQGSTWVADYGFIPMVWIAHNKVKAGPGYGWGEAHVGYSKIREIDDLASKLSDQIRKGVDPVWLMSGVDAPDSTPKFDAQGRPVRRDDMRTIYAPTGAAAQALIASVDIGGALAAIAGINEQLERDYPEIKLMILRGVGTTSGEALRTAQEPVVAKVEKRRTPYDWGIVRAQQMAMSIGGMNGYPGYEAFDAGSYERGDLNHDIGSRPVFGTAADARATHDAAVFAAAKAAMSIGIDPLIYLRDAGWSEDRLDEIRNSRLYKALSFAEYP